MKTIIITAALVTSLIALGYSQNKPERPSSGGPRSERSGEARQTRTPEQRAQLATDALERKLNLTAEQKVKVYALNLERAEKMEKTMNSDEELRKDQMQKNKALMEDMDKKLSNILTKEQQQSYQEMKAQSREKMKARRMQEAKGKVN